MEQRLKWETKRAALVPENYFENPEEKRISRHDWGGNLQGSVVETTGCKKPGRKRKAKQAKILAEAIPGSRENNFFPKTIFLKEKIDQGKEKKTRRANSMAL
jgi:hypothetical protein